MCQTMTHNNSDGLMLGRLIRMYFESMSCGSLFLPLIKLEELLKD